MIHIEDNDTCAMAALRADAGKWLKCSESDILVIMTVYLKPVKGEVKLFDFVIIIRFLPYILSRGESCE